MKRYSIYTYFLSLLAAFGFFFLIEKDIDKDCETLRNRHSLKQYSGIITKKYIDKNDHDAITIVIEGHKFPYISLAEWGIYFDFETTGVYDYLQVGDSIVKAQGNHELKIKRNNIDTIWIMDLYCRD